MHNITINMALWKNTWSFLVKWTTEKLQLVRYCEIISSPGFFHHRGKEGVRKEGKKGRREGRWEEEGDRGGGKVEKRQKISDNLTKEGKKLCLNWSPHIFTLEEKFLTSLFFLKPLFYSPCSINRWGEPPMQWEYQENHTTSISHKTLAQHVDKTEQAIK